MSKQKFYVVWKGREVGVYRTWKECEQMIKGYEGARYKSFETEQQAREAFAGGIPPYNPFGASSVKKKTLVANPILNSICVDAACSGNPGVMEYRGVSTAARTELFHQGPFPEGTVNIGEFLAIVHGLSYLKNRGFLIPVYSDSMTAIKWVRDKKANTKLQRNSKNSELFDLVVRAENWLKANTYDNPVLKWDTSAWGEIYADFGRK